MYKLKGSLETTCTHVKGNLEQNMYKFQEKFGNNSMYTCKGKCGNTMYKSKEIWKHDEQIQRKSRKNNAAISRKFWTQNVQIRRDLCKHYVIQISKGIWEHCKKKAKENLEKQMFSVQCTVYNLQESLETQCTRALIEHLRNKCSNERKDWR